MSHLALIFFQNRRFTMVIMTSNRNSSSQGLGLLTLLVTLSQRLMVRR